MEAARRSESYTVPRSLQTRVSQHAQATENVATEEMRKKPPQLEDVQSTRRKLGEMLRHGESEILEGGHNEILVAGASTCSNSLANSKRIVCPKVVSASR